MANGDGINRQKLSERANEGEPLVDTPLFDMLAETDLPFRGEIRQNILIRVRESARQRRTVDGIASRIANNAVSPISSAIEAEVEDRVRDQVVESLQNQADRDGGVSDMVRRE